MKPEVLLLDEPTSALDPISTSRIEELVIELKNNFTIVIVTGAAGCPRISDYTACMYLGELVEYSVTDEIFRPRRRKPRLPSPAVSVDGSAGRARQCCVASPPCLEPEGFFMLDTEKPEGAVGESTG